MKDRNKNISLDVDSALALMQEIYNDITELRNTASIITKKMLSFMKESEDMSIIGPVIKDQQKILNDCTEKKISIVKLQAILLKQSGGNTKEGFSKMTLSAEDRKLLDELVKDDDDSNKLRDGEYSTDGKN
jgi:hypothetical protein